jgi:hypothetical protein
MSGADLSHRHTVDGLFRAHYRWLCAVICVVICMTPPVLKTSPPKPSPNCSKPRR